MSTPVHYDSPSQAKPEVKPLTDDELQLQLQRMIELQYEQQSYIGGQPPPPPPLAPPPPAEEPSPNASIDIQHTPIAVSTASYSNLYSFEEEVGHGTLVFPTSLPRPPRTDSEPSDDRSYDEEMTVPHNTIRASYGAINDLSDALNSADHDMDEIFRNHDDDPVGKCWDSFWGAEALHRSFCYGAIDGMVTGSGLIAAFCGLGLLSYRSPSAIRGLVIVFSIAAGVADSLCIALGHVWTTGVLTTAQAKEKTRVQKQFETARAESKGQLVDLFLSRGMLKIDAMSLADTLEGYPDMFISALMSETFATADTDAPSPTWLQTVTSYGNLTDAQMDPEARMVQRAMDESRRESFFMMLGFSIFTMIPSLIFWVIPYEWQGPAKEASIEIATTTAPQHASSGSFMHPLTLAVLMGSVVMGSLGVWKSRFLDGSMFIFAVETIVVLLLGISAAFGVGYVLGSLFLPNYSWHVDDEDL